MKLAQIKQFVTLPLILGVNYLKPEEKFGLDGIRIAYMVSQIISLLVLVKIFLAAKKSSDETMVKVPEVKSMGTVVKPAAEMTVAQYDVSQVQDLLKQTVMGAGILGLIHWKWATVMPVVIQTLLTPFNTLTHNVTLVYLWGMPAEGELARPWVAASPFEMPKIDDPEAEAKKKAEEKAAKKEEKKAAGVTGKKKGFAAPAAAAPKPAPVAKAAASAEALALAADLHKLHKSELADLTVKQLKEHLSAVGARPQLVASCPEKRDMVDLLQDVVETLMDNDFSESKKTN